VIRHVDDQRYLFYEPEIDTRVEVTKTMPPTIRWSAPSKEMKLLPEGFMLMRGLLLAVAEAMREVLRANGVQPPTK